MSEQSVELRKEITREEICTNCKGKGTSFGIRMSARLKGAGTLLLGFVGLLLSDFIGGGFMGWLIIFLLVAGVIKIIAAQVAKCPVCKGSGKVELVANKVE